MKTIMSLVAVILMTLVNVCAQNVGIGTLVPHPTATLQVVIPANNGLLVNGTLDVLTATIPDLGAGSRLMFFPGKGVFRAGAVSGISWNSINVGINSTAFGFNTTAKGASSTAMGSFTSANGDYTTTMGLGTRAVSAGEVAVGTYNAGYTPSSPTNWVGTDHVFSIGNGTSIDDLSDALVVLKNGNTGIGYSAPIDRLQVNGNGFFNGNLSVIADATILGFTRLGGNSNAFPKIKIKKLSGISSNSQGTWTNVAHGLAAAKILAVDILMDVPGFVHLTPYYTFTAGYEYQYQVADAFIVVLNMAGNSANILSKGFTALITYEE